MNPLLLAPAALLGFLIGTFRSQGKKPPAKAPLVGVKLGAWEKFVGVMAASPRDAVSARYRLGAFGMDARRLADVGAMTKAYKGSYGTEVGVWLGNWAPSLTESAFLGSMPLQYAAFVRSVRRSTAAPEVSGFVGEVVDGVPCSLSGLLGVSHVAGVAGVASWVKDPVVRRKFAATTEVFKKTNGLF